MGSSPSGMTLDCLNLFSISEPCHIQDQAVELLSPFHLQRGIRESLTNTHTHIGEEVREIGVALLIGWPSLMRITCSSLANLLCVSMVCH